MVFPVVVGSGKRHFWDGVDTKVLRLVGTKAFPRAGQEVAEPDAFDEKAAEERAAARVAGC